MKTVNKIFTSAEELKEFLKKFNKNSYVFVQIFSSTGDKKVLKKIIKTIQAYFTNVDIIGTTTAGEIYNTEILENKIIISFNFTDKKVLVKEFDLQKISSKNAAKELLKEIDKNTSNLIIYADAFKFNPDDFLEVLNTLNKKPNLFGALGANNDSFETKVFTKNKIYTHGVVIAIIKNLKTQSFNITEYINSNTYFEITKYSKNKIYSINKKPAYLFFEEYFDEKIQNLSFKTIFAIPLMFKEIPRSILKINKTYTVITGNVLDKKASFGIPDISLAKQKLYKNLTDIKQKEINQGLLTFSYGKKLIMEEEIKKELQYLNIKAVGFVGYGEMYLKENRYIFCTNSINFTGFKSEFVFEDIHLTNSSKTKELLLKTAIKITSELNKQNIHSQRLIKRKYEKLLKLQRMFYTQLNEIYTKEMVALFSHQLRQPLNSISISMSNLALNIHLENIDPKEILNTTEFVQEQCVNVSQKLHDFFPFENTYQCIKVSKIINKIKNILSTQLYNRKIDFFVNVKEDFTICGNISLFHSALMGIIFYLRDTLKQSEKKEISIIIQNSSIIIKSSSAPELKNILSLKSQDIRILVSRNILMQEFNIKLFIKPKKDSFIITLKKRET